MIGENDVAELLRAATDDIVVAAVPARELATAGSRRRRRRQVVAGVALATAVAAVAVGVPLALAGGSAERQAPAVDPTAVPPGAHCVDPVPSRVLPEWARGGFSAERPRIPFVLGDDGEIAAILFAQPLTAPPSKDHNNKILWVAHGDFGSSLRITATLVDGSATVTRVVDGGPGPSIIDLPSPGCWHLTLQGAGATDTMNLAYTAP